MKEQKEKLIIDVDDREPSIIFDIGEMNHPDIILNKKRLKIGDYVFGSCCIERKEINDFCSSIIDGRLSRQIENMKQHYPTNLIIIVGHIKVKNSTIHENCILGKMASITIKHQVPIIMLDDEFQFVYFISSLCKKYSKILEELKQ